MSDMTPCNFCTLQSIRARAKKLGKKVEVRAAPDKKHGWMNGKSVRIGGKQVAWFMELTESCAC